MCVNCAATYVLHDVRGADAAPGTYGENIAQHKGQLMNRFRRLAAVIELWAHSTDGIALDSGQETHRMATVALYTIDGDEHDDHVSMRFRFD